jgi:hypothetical protein
MKKIGLICLLTMGYAGILTAVFDSDFGRTHSFLPTENAQLSAGRAFSASSLAEADFVMPAADDASGQQPMTAVAQLEDGHQSPESASEH